MINTFFYLLFVGIYSSVSTSDHSYLSRIYSTSVSKQPESEASIHRTLGWEREELQILTTYFARRASKTSCYIDRENCLISLVFFFLSNFSGFLLQL